MGGDFGLGGGVMSQCTRCKARGKPENFGSDPRCAFLSGVFNSDNWNCATMNEIRYRVTVDLEGSPAHAEDRSAALLPWGYRFVLIGWYKNRGCTELAGVLNETHVAPLTLKDAEAFLSGGECETDD